MSDSYDQNLFARFRDPLDLIGFMEERAEEVLKGALEKLGATGQDAGPRWDLARWAPDSVEGAAARILPIAFYARIHLQPPLVDSQECQVSAEDAVRQAKGAASWFAQLTIAWCVLSDALAERDAAKIRTTPAARANRRKWAEFNTPMYIEAVEVIRAADYVISATACAERVCGERQASHVRKLLIKRGLFRELKANGPKQYVPNRTLIDVEFPLPHGGGNLTRSPIDFVRR